MAQPAVMLEHHRSAIERGESNTSIFQQVRCVELVLFQVCVGLCWEQNGFVAIIDRQRVFPGRDQDATVVIREEKQLSEVAIRLAAWNGPYLIAYDLLQPNPSL